MKTIGKILVRIVGVAGVLLLALPLLGVAIFLLPLLGGYFTSKR